MKNNKIPTVVMMSTNVFVDKFEAVRNICKKYKAKEILDDVTNTILFYFYDNESWVKAKQEMQLVVERINFKLSSKRVIIIEEMKDIIVDPSQPPAWFLEFQKWIVNKFEQIDARFDKQDEFNKKQNEFNNYVISRFDKLDRRLDNIVRLNNLKE
ncbi:MAG: hypothetical protein LBJ97_03595 [Mycoplasmataceae bacterium]|jgi:hypothetical protein|nr:hypothetical protein [Mycoplasmataceae bacterium]